MLPSPLRLCAISILAFAALLPVSAAEKPRPLMRDFIGLCVHTVQFKPELYRPVTRLLRDYHPVKWDLGQPMSFTPPFPKARNGVDWSALYGKWKAAGNRTHASLMFDDMAPAEWGDVPRNAALYGKALAEAFGPSSAGLLEAAEIGNEPGKYDDASYRALFEAMAGAIRRADPKMRIGPCAVNLGPSGRYSKSVDCLRGLESLYDIVNIHVYPEVEGWPTWRRSFPEDSAIEFQRHLGHVLEWRRLNVPEKEVWLTEFGWDASTKPAPASGTFAKWVGSSETQQARWIVRGFMVLAGLGIDRAYLFFFNDKDDAHVHGSSGLTRNFEPKPAFHALAHLQRTLGDYRFSRIVRSGAEDLFVYEFVHESDPRDRVWAIWRSHSAPRKVSVPLEGLRFEKAERLPLNSEPAAAPECTANAGILEIEASEDPSYVSLRET